jgi:hypothetical protein
MQLNSAAGSGIVKLSLGWKNFFQDHSRGSWQDLENPLPSSVHSCDSPHVGFSIGCMGIFRTWQLITRKTEKRAEPGEKCTRKSAQDKSHSGFVNLSNNITSLFVLFFLFRGITGLAHIQGRTEMGQWLEYKG